MKCGSSDLKAKGLSHICFVQHQFTSFFSIDIDKIGSSCYNIQDEGVVSAFVRSKSTS